MARSGPETKISRAIIKALEARGCIVYKQHGTEVSGRGRPDLLGCLPGGQMFALETKTPVGSATKIQLRHMRLLAGVGAATGFPTSVEDALGLLGLSPRPVGLGE